MFSTLFLMNCILGNVIVTFNVFFNKPNTITKNKNNFINIPTFLSLYSLDFANEEADASEQFPMPLCVQQITSKAAVSPCLGSEH